MFGMEQDILKVIADHPIKILRNKDIFYLWCILEFIFEVWKNRTNKLLSVIIKFDSDISKELITNLIEKYADSERPVKATEKAAKALWQFLDGMCEHHQIKCDMTPV